VSGIVWGFAEHQDGPTRLWEKRHLGIYQVQPNLKEEKGSRHEKETAKCAQCEGDATFAGRNRQVKVRCTASPCFLGGEE